jgi:hypothetical protein
MMGPLRVLEPFASGSPSERLQRLQRRLFSETGIVTGTLHHAASWVRNRRMSEMRRRMASTLRLTPEETRQVHALRERLCGDFVCRDAGLVQQVLAYGRRFREEFGDVTIEDVEEARAGQQNTFFHNVYEGQPGDPFRRLALHPELLRVVSGYFGEVPVLQDIELNLSPADTRGKPWVGSQRWHRDIDQPSKVKLFVLMHDVTLDHGPTLVLPRAQSRLSQHPNFPGTFSDEEARRAGIDLDGARVFTGRAGDMLLVDTGRLVHCGSRDPKHTRFLLIITYGPPRSRLTAHNERRCLRAPHLVRENQAIPRRLSQD